MAPAGNFPGAHALMLKFGCSISLEHSEPKHYLTRIKSRVQQLDETVILVVVTCAWVHKHQKGDPLEMSIL